jgi:uncharacterized protein YjiS (DUF1127 family)
MNILTQARAWLKHRHTVAQLRGLSNDTLDDIGLNRHDLLAGHRARFGR